MATPGDRPFQALAQALVPQFAGDAEAMQELLQFEERTPRWRLVSRWRRRHDHALLDRRSVRGALHPEPPEVQERFAELLGRLALEADVHVLLSMRDDFLFHCHEPSMPWRRSSPS